MIATAVLTTGLSAFTALVTIVVTNFLTRRREQEADWRKLKLAQYQQLINAFSGIEKSRYTPESVRVFTDAVNATSLIASLPVLRALKLYLDANASNNPERNESETNRLYSHWFTCFGPMFSRQSTGRSGLSICTSFITARVAPEPELRLRQFPLKKPPPLRSLLHNSALRISCKPGLFSRVRRFDEPAAARCMTS